MIYVTGDIHGDISRFKSKEVKNLTKDDYLIVCGDFGFIWDNSTKEKLLLKWIGKRKYTTLFIDGTHDNLDLLSNYSSEDFKGGKARRISGNLLYLERGNIFNIDNKKIFAFGGGQSDDYDVRINKNNWWKNELPSQDEIDFAIENLLKYDNTVDYIITHQAPHKILVSLNEKYIEPNLLTYLLDKIANECVFGRWFFGCYHVDKIIPISYIANFKNIILTEQIR